MKLIRLLLVDDESLVLNAMKQCVERAGLGFEVIIASNGRQALELSHALHPQVVISDIEMPQMDGLTFLQELKNINPYSQIYVLSGYQNFNYAKRAIDIGVKRYLIKPIEEDTLLNLLAEARTTLEYNNVLLEENRSRHKLACKSLLSEFFTLSINGISIPGEIQRQLPSLMPQGPYMLVLLQAAREASPHTAFNCENPLPSPYLYLEEITSRVLDRSKTEGILILLRKNEYILLSGLRTDGALQHGASLVKTICQEADAVLNVRLTASISLNGTAGSPLEDAYRECICALEDAFRTKGSLILRYRSGAGYVEAQKQMAQMMECMETLSYHNLRPYILQIYDALSSDDFELHRSLELTEVLLHTLLQKQIVYQPLQNHLQPSLASCETLYHMRELVLEQAAVLCEYDKTSISKTESLINKAQQYITDNLRDVSLSKVSEAIGCTPIYLSTVFKNSTGIKFIDYITSMKINSAKNMLADSNIRIHYIADQLGYMDAKYFSQIFKKNVGMTPNEYRMALESKQKTQKTVALNTYR